MQRASSPLPILQSQFRSCEVAAFLRQHLRPLFLLIKSYCYKTPAGGPECRFIPKQSLVLPLYQGDLNAQLSLTGRSNFGHTAVDSSNGWRKLDTTKADVHGYAVRFTWAKQDRLPTENAGTDVTDSSDGLIRLHSPPRF